MQYAKGSVGRIFLVKFEHKEDMLEKLKELVHKEDIRSATITFLGALEKACLVAGPAELKTPANPSWVKFKDGREVVGYGTIMRDGGDVKIHLHAAVGKKSSAFVGCLRAECSVFITVEAMVMELTDIAVSRKMDNVIGHALLFFSEDDEVKEGPDDIA